MSSKLMALLEKIDLKNTADEISARVDDAINTFGLKTNTVTDLQTFQKTCADFYCHVENVIFGFDPPRTVHFVMDWGRFDKRLKEIYGQNGKMIGFDLSRLGHEGGLKTVLKLVADKMREGFVNSFIHSEICEFWDSLTIDEKLSAVKEYVETYSHLLPEEAIENGAPRIGINFHEVLKQHPYIIKQIRDIGRKF